MSTMAEQLWAALTAGKVPAPQPSAVTVPKREKSRERDAEAPQLTRAEWTAVECVLVVVTRKCKCGATTTAPDRVMIGYRDSKLKAIRYLPIKPDQLPCSYPRSIKTVEISVNYCHSCFMHRGFELQETLPVPAQEKKDGNDQPGDREGVSPSSTSPNEGTRLPLATAEPDELSVRGDSNLGTAPSPGVIFFG